MIPPAVLGFVAAGTAAAATAGVMVWASGRYSRRVSTAGRRAARPLGLTVDAVRIGLRGVKPGQLALAADRSGRLGLAEAADGRVALSGEEDDSGT